MEQEMNCITFNGKQCSKGATAYFHACAAMGMLPISFTRTSQRNSVTNEKVVTNIMTMAGRDKNGNRSLSTVFEMVKEYENKDTLESLAGNLENYLSNVDVNVEDKIKLSLSINALKEGNFAEANSNAINVLKSNPVHMGFVKDKLERRGFACEDYKGLRKTEIGARVMY